LQIKPFVFLIAVILLSPGVKAQIKIQTYTTATDTFYWKRYQHVPKPVKLNLKPLTVAGAKKIKESFLAKCLSQFPQFTNDSANRFGFHDIKKCLFPIDLNGDRLPDMIFSGFSGGESDIIRIFLNRGDTFELVFEDYQYISQMVREKGKLTQLQTGDVGCCDAYLYFTRDYKVISENGKLDFIKGKQIVVYENTEEPIHYYTQPVPFTSRSDTMMVRASATQLNEPFNPHLETFGNIVAKYRSKTRGLILAQKSITNGDDWYFVEIFPDVSPSASILYEIDKIPTFLRGWVSGQAIVIK